ncbi:MAG: hypothetical protein WC421_09095 [Elusimicrobiales bacterium]
MQIPPGLKSRSAIIAACFAAAALVYSLTLTNGHGWRWDDGAQYIAHARNIAEGRPYAATGYIFNPQNPMTGPASYPPVYPALLSPVYKLFGLNMIAFKLVNVLLMFLCLALLCALAAKEEKSETAASLALFAALPAVFWLRQLVYADWLCLALMYAAFLAFRRGGAAAGLLLGLAYSTRVAGLAGYLALAADDIFRNRKITARLVRMSVIFFALAAAQKIMMPAIAGSYYISTKILLPGHDTPISGRYMSSPFNEVFIPDGMSAPFVAALCVLLAAAATGMYIRRGRLTAADWLAAGCPLTFIICSDGVRTLLPLLPFIPLNCIAAAKAVRDGRTRFLAGAALILCGAMAYIGSFASVWQDYDISRPPSKQLFAAIKANTEPDAVFIARKPRMLALMTGRKASIYPQNSAPQAQLEYYRSVKAGYLLETWWLRKDREIIAPLLAARPGCFAYAYGNEMFRVYKLKLDFEQCPKD